MRSEIERTVRNKYNSIIERFNGQVRKFSLTVENIRTYNTDLMDSANRFIENSDWKNQANTNLYDITNSLASWLMQDRKREEEEEIRNQKTLETLMVFFKQAQYDKEFIKLHDDIKKWALQRKERETKAYSEAMLNSEYE